MGTGTRTRISEAQIDEAGTLVQEIYLGEMRYPKSPVTADLVRLNLDHAVRVRAIAAGIADGEGLDPHLLQLTAMLHDVAKLDHREKGSGGIDTWHHHHRGAALARKLVLVELGLSASVAESVAEMTFTHSYIPFIRRFWESQYGAPLPSPETPEQVALRDADMVDLLWVGGVAKIVEFRQVSGSLFYEEDGGDIQKAIASSRRSFEESVESISTATARRLVLGRIETINRFFTRLGCVGNLDEFRGVYDDFLSEFHEAAPADPQ